MNDLVTLHDGQLVTTTLAIAEGTENEHASVIALARKYQRDLEEFGPCRFEIDVVKRPQGGGSEREIAILNERQSTLLLTYMRNSDIVRTFKKRLVRRFYEMAQELQPKPAPIAATLDKKLAIGRAAVDWFGLSDVNKIRLLANIARSENIDPSFLPIYPDHVV